MAIQDQIDRISAAKDDIKAAIEEKGVTVPSGTTIEGYASLIRGISSGSAIEEIPVTNRIEFSYTEHDLFFAVCLNNGIAHAFMIDKTLIEGFPQHKLPIKLYLDVSDYKGIYMRQAGDGKVRISNGANMNSACDKLRVYGLKL